MNQFESFASHLFKNHYENQKPHVCLPGVKTWLEELLVKLFPEMGQITFENSDTLLRSLLQSREKLEKILSCSNGENHTQSKEDAEIIFTEELPHIYGELEQDLIFFVESDPACHSQEEVISSYPGFLGVCCYRIARSLFKKEYRLLARMITEVAHSKTGIDIHPGAQIESPFFIDHGTGVVVGETAVIGRRVKIYQGVTVGALSVQRVLKGEKRHPTIEDDCILYANATILGGETVVGRGSTVGGNTSLVKSISANSLVYLKSNQVIKEKK